MSNEIAGALRTLADRIDAGLEMKGKPPNACVVVLADGVECAVTYCGHDQPGYTAGLFMMGEGIKRLSMASLGQQAPSGSAH